MNQLRSTLVAVLSALSLSIAAPPAFAASLTTDLQKSWAQQRAMLTAAADAMPEESFDFKPTPEQRTFGEQILHISGANSFLMRFTGTDTELVEVSLANLATFGLEASTKPEYLAALEQSFDNGIAALADFSDDDMLEEVQGPPWVGKVTRAAMVNFILGHTMDIYGQMVVYLRLEGVVPPASRR